MSKTIHDLLNESMLKIMRPLMRVMLRNGISCGSVEELVRKTYVDEAFAVGKKNKLKTTISSVSAQTGLSRKEVKRLHELDDVHHVDVEQKYNRAIRIISGWLNDEDFTDPQGNARMLSLDDGEHSFSALAKRFSGDIPAKAMLDSLIAADCVTVKDNKVQLIKHAYVPGTDPVEIIRILGTDTNELINTIDFNLTVADKEKRYQRKVSTTLLNQNAIKEFKTISKKLSQSLLEELDTWLSQNEVNPDDDNARYVSVGIYYYEQ